MKTYQNWMTESTRACAYGVILQFSTSKDYDKAPYRVTIISDIIDEEGHPMMMKIERNINKSRKMFCHQW